MNHRPFEDWLLDDEPLTPQQQRDLEAHVRSCSTCAAIAESNLALHAAHLVAPADGFADRFRVRLEKRRQEQKWRQVIGTLVLVVGGVLLVYWLAGPFLLQVLQTPATFLTAGINYVVFLFTFLHVFSEASAIILRVLPKFISPAGWVGLTITAAGLGLLWTLSIQRVARAPQGV